MTQEEQPLYGGLVDGRVVRLGDSVRRPAGAWTPAVHAVLQHLEHKGFPAPRALGLDEQGREKLSFLPGRAGLWPWPPALLSLDGAAEAGAFVAAFHRAMSDYKPASPGAIWRHGVQDLAPGEIVIHGDLGPYNMIWDGDRLGGLIDFELARPGQAMEDVVFCAVRVAALRDDEAVRRYGFADPPDRKARLAAFAEGYGCAAADILDQAAAIQTDEIARMERLGGAGVEPWATFLARDLPRVARAELAWMQANLTQLRD